ncbi:hypothetical protein GQX73_g2740 [Xylaria multiplex]|uniref:Uncharacterized protein n=1 Tax=Xylaria multiplex TaxID=323545 RepID=A0A7C8MQ27_9PEZI|nr:hypothetical protein GQX73_g2740 [Xylaria multiplex]
MDARTQALQALIDKLPQDDDEEVHNLRAALQAACVRLPAVSVRPIVLIDGDNPAEIQFGDMSVAGAIVIMREERELRRPIYFEGSFTYEHVILPEWPQLPHVIAAAANLHRYTFNLGNHDIEINRTGLA